MTDDIKALVAKLREKPSYWHQPTYVFLHSDAADAIEALESENESLRIDNLGHELGHTDAMLRTRLERAEQERDRLKVQSDILWQGLNDAKTHIERAEQERDAYAAVIAGVLAVHEPGERDDGLGGYLCEGCDSRWENCPTRRILSYVPADILAARDRRVAAEALRSAFSLTTDDDYVFRSTDNVRDWLRARADQIENGSADG